MKFSVELSVTYILDWQILTIRNINLFRPFEWSWLVEIIEICCYVIRCTKMSKLGITIALSDVEI